MHIIVDMSGNSFNFRLLKTFSLLSVLIFNLRFQKCTEGYIRALYVQYI